MPTNLGNILWLEPPGLKHWVRTLCSLNDQLDFSPRAGSYRAQPEPGMLPQAPPSCVSLCVLKRQKQDRPPRHLDGRGRTKQAMLTGAFICFTLKAFHPPSSRLDMKLKRPLHFEHRWAHLLIQHFPSSGPFPSDSPPTAIPAPVTGSSASTAGPGGWMRQTWLPPGESLMSHHREASSR